MKKKKTASGSHSGASAPAERTVSLAADTPPETTSPNPRGAEFYAEQGQLGEGEWEVTRRSFLKWLGGALGLAGVGSLGLLGRCRRPETLMVPYTRTPEWVVPGKPTLYATMLPQMCSAVALLATTHEGRPTKLEPNSEITEKTLLGTGDGVKGFAQAALMDLYSPGRSREVLHCGKPVAEIFQTPEAGQAEFEGAFRAWSEKLRSGAPMGFLFGDGDSVSRREAMALLKAINPQVRFYSWEAVSNRTRVKVGEDLLGKGRRIVANPGNAERILSLGCDFLGLDEAGDTRAFFRKRDPDANGGTMNRLYIAESGFSVTGGIADHRLRCPSSQLPRLAISLAEAISRFHRDEELLGVLEAAFAGLGLDSASVFANAEKFSLTQPVRLANHPLLVSLPDLSGSDSGIPARDLNLWLLESARDLLGHRGRSLILAGRDLPAATQGLVLLLNRVLHAFGPGSQPLPDPAAPKPPGSSQSQSADRNSSKSLPNPPAGNGSPLQIVETPYSPLPGIPQLVSDIEQDKLEWLAILTPSDPVIHAPDPEAMRALLSRPGLETVHWGLFANSCARACRWHVPAAHHLESWADARTPRGQVLLGQPLILPLYHGYGELEFLLGLAHPKGELVSGETTSGEPSPAYFFVQYALAKLARWPGLAPASSAPDSADLAPSSQPPASPPPPSPSAASSASPQNPRPLPEFTAQPCLAGEARTLWQETLRSGMLALPYPEFLPQSLEISLEPLKDLLRKSKYSKAPVASAPDIEFVPSHSLWDGRFINNPWLQEAPDPVTKLTWDNAMLVSPATARALGIDPSVIPDRDPASLSSLAGVSPSEVIRTSGAPMARIQAGDSRLSLPVLVVPGQADNTLILAIGYGQGNSPDDPYSREAPANTVTDVGRDSGFNVAALRPGKSFATSSLRPNATVTPLPANAPRYPLAITAGHHDMLGRDLVRRASLEKLPAAPAAAPGRNSPRMYEPVGSSFWHPQPAFGTGATPAAQARPFTGISPRSESPQPPLLDDRNHQWGMTVDLSRCIGCNACLLACQAENNIPCVGREQVAKSREMHWLRLDRYFAPPAAPDCPDWLKDSPQLLVQPVACAQCELAPCESVCPVNATVHSEDGLNAMAYNRCVGTRFCANNCPYRARRFNFFDFNKRNPYIPGNLEKGPFGETQSGEAPHLQRNPNVTVRMRGVMEKCTFCVQRIQAAKIRQKRNTPWLAELESGNSAETEISWQDLRIPADSFQTACQAACPAQAIQFGNLLDRENSAVWRTGNSPRSYALLPELGVKPRTLFLARVNNPNPHMPDSPFLAP